MTQQHTDASFDEELRQLENTILLMGNTVKGQIDDAIEALLARDNTLANNIISKDKKINELEDAVDGHTIRLLSLRQPVGVDLRNIMAATKIATDLERIADYVANVAMHIPGLNSIEVEDIIESLISMTRIARGMLIEIMGVYKEPDEKKIVHVWHQDDAIDEIYPKVLTALTDYMKKHPENVKSYTSLIFVGRSVERIGDHITNIAEQIYYVIKGRVYRGTDETHQSKKD